MASEWKVMDDLPASWGAKRIGDIATVKGGKRLPAGTTLVEKPTSHPYLRIVDFKDGRIDSSNLMYVPDDVFPRISRYTISFADIYISIVGTIGLVGKIGAQLDGANLTENAAKICNIDSSVERDYLLAFLRSRWGQHQISSLAVGTTQPKLALYRIADIICPVPPLSEQQAIACILEALDDKIELNRKTNQILEEIAGTIFKSWFVDFDPVHAKANGQQIPGLAPPIADLFPDSFEESELGEIPKGWRGESLTGFAQVIGGGTPKTKVPDYWGGNIPWFSVVDAPSPSDIFVVETEKKITQAGLDNSSTRVLPVGTTIITARGTVGKLAMVGTPMAMNQSCYGLRTQNDGFPSFLYFTLKRMVGLLQQHSHGSVFDTITRATLEQMRFVQPSDLALLAYERLVNPLLDRVRNNLSQVRDIAELRDILLPRLISGELRVPDAERIVSRCI